MNLVSAVTTFLFFAARGSADAFISSGKSSFDPKKLTNVKLIQKNFMSDKEQQDAEELLQLLLSGVDEEVSCMLRESYFSC